MRVVLNHPDKSTILRMGPNLISIGPCNQRVVAVIGKPLTLNDFEHRNRRGGFKDPSIHYTVNCASLGCHNLAPQAYTGADLTAMLDAAQRSFVNHPWGVRFDANDVVLSQIFEWHRTDFTADETQLLAYLARVADEPLATRLAQHSGKVRYHYKWALNAALSLILSGATSRACRSPTPPASVPQQLIAPAVLRASCPSCRSTD